MTTFQVNQDYLASLSFLPPLILQKKH